MSQRRAKPSRPRSGTQPVAQRGRAHALRAGTATYDNVAATLADLAAGAGPGRTGEDEIVIFDSTGTGVQDVAVAAAAYDAVRTGNGDRP